MEMDKPNKVSSSNPNMTCDGILQVKKEGSNTTPPINPVMSLNTTDVKDRPGNKSCTVDAQRNALPDDRNVNDNSASSQVGQLKTISDPDATSSNQVGQLKKTLASLVATPNNKVGKLRRTISEPDATSSNQVGQLKTGVASPVTPPINQFGQLKKTLASLVPTPNNQVEQLKTISDPGATPSNQVGRLKTISDPGATPSNQVGQLKTISDPGAISSNQVGQLKTISDPGATPSNQVGQLKTVVSPVAKSTNQFGQLKTVSSLVIIPKNQVEQLKTVAGPYATPNNQVGQLKTVADPYATPNNQVGQLKTVADPYATPNNQVGQLKTVADPYATPNNQVGQLKTVADPYATPKNQVEQLKTVADPYATPNNQVGQLKTVADTYATPKYQVGQLKTVADPYATPNNQVGQLKTVADPYATPKNQVGQLKTVADTYATPKYQVGQLKTVADPYATPNNQVGQLKTVADTYATPKYQVGQLKTVADPYATPNNQVGQLKNVLSPVVTPKNQVGQLKIVASSVATPNNQIGQLKTVAISTPINQVEKLQIIDPGPSLSNQVGHTYCKAKGGQVATPTNQFGQLQTIGCQGAIPVSIVPSIVQTANKKSQKGPFPVVVKVPEVVNVSPASHTGTLTLLSENVNVVQALPNSARTTPTIAPRNTKGRKLNYKFISTVGQKASTSNGSEVISPDHIKSSGFEPTNYANGGGLSNLFKSGPKHAAKIVPDCFADKVKGSPYKCHGCCDSYTFQSSLNMHVNRCSSLIKYKCPFCNVTKHFFNKCSLFIHAREHARVTKKPFELRANLANLSVLPSQGTDLFRNQESKGEEDSAKAPNQKMVASPVNQTQLNKDSTAEVVKTVDKVLDRSQELYIKDGMKMCLICMESFTVHNTKAMHFKRETKRVVCQLCDQILFNPCMAELHKNYHLHRQPLQCPDCGLVSGTEQEAYRHIQQMCFHMSRKILVRCSICNIYVSSFKVYQNHLLDRHAESFFKCVECQLAYRSVESLKCHTVVEHKNSNNSSMCNIILKCPLCETVFGNKKQLTTHIQTTHTYSDLSDTKVVHECSHCGKLFQQLSSLDTHMLVTHKNCAGHFHCEFCNRAVEFSDLAAHKRHCSLKLHSKLKRPEDVGMLMSKDTDSQDAVSMTNKNVAEVFKCLQCSKDGKDITFQSKSEIETHYLIMHKESVSKDAGDVASTSAMQTSNVTESDSEERKRKADSPDGPAPLKRLKIVVPRKDFKCALCDFTCPARGDFKNHLLENHDANGAIQCQECGLSFRASLSHKMHLRAIHKIYALDQYFNQQHTSVKEIVKSEEKPEKKVKVKTSLVNQIMRKFDCTSMECQVCYKVFDSEINLRTHMRNHGMAFIKSKRKMAMDCPEGK